MKKILPIVFVAIVVVIFSGCYSSKEIKNNQQSSNENIEKNEESGTMGEMMEQLEKIKDGESMKCVYTIKMDGKEFQSESYVEGEKYKSISIMGADDDAKTYVIFDGETQYSWVDGQTEGFKMNLDCASELGGTDDQSIEEESAPEEIMGTEDIFENAINVDCQPFSDIDFSVPSEINFVDQCEMLKDQMKQIEELKGAVPEGFQIPADME